MTPIKQTRLSDPSTGTLGNCMQACFASVFDLPIESVPDFIMIEKEGGEDWIEVMFRFLAEHGAAWHGSGTPEQLTDSRYNQGIDGYVFVGGTSPRGKAICPQGHMVIYKDGKPFFDPHPSNDFLDDVEDFWMIGRA